MVRVAPGVRISPKTTGLPPGTDTSEAAMPRFFIKAAIASALRWMSSRSRAMFGSASSPMSSSTIARSCCCRQLRAAAAAGLVCAAPALGSRVSTSRASTRSCHRTGLGFWLRV